MHPSSGLGKGKNLAAVLAGLKPDSPCPCCAAPLRPPSPTISVGRSRLVERAGGQEAQPGEGRVIVLCAECGCELDALEAPEDADGSRGQGLCGFTWVAA
jgi:hypothetical protein